MKNILKSILRFMLFSAFFFSCKPTVHEHTFNDKWTSNETDHWHAATCEHTNEINGKSNHIWNHSDYQYDSESGKEIRSCSVCFYVDEKEHIHTEDSGTITAESTCVTKGTKIYKCNICGNERKEEILELYSSPIDAETGKDADKSSTYVYFGVFPRTLKEPSVKVDETESVIMGCNTYFKGSDGDWYINVTVNPYSSEYSYSYDKYSDDSTITKGNIDYFKVEPIKWKVLTTDYNNTGNALLFAEDILTAGIPYYVNRDDRIWGDDIEYLVYANDYKYSTIRAYLNGKYEEEDIQEKTAYLDKGFLQTAFSFSAQKLIADTEVINDGKSTSDETGVISKADGTVKVDYFDKTYPNCICDNTIDKIFLLSEQEVTTTAYGFSAYNKNEKENARIRFTTDYAKANYAYQSSSSGYGGIWMLRSPYYRETSIARYVTSGGDTNFYDMIYVDRYERGVVPALTITLE